MLYRAEEDEVFQLNYNDYIVTKSNRKTYIQVALEPPELEPISIPKLKFKPANEEQLCFVDAFYRDNISVLAVTGPAGSGKSYCPLACAIESIQQEKYRKLIIIRSMIPSTKHKLGFLPGRLDEKLAPRFAAVYDAFDALVDRTKLFSHDATSELDAMIDSEKLEIATLEFFRGRSINDTIIFCDDAQNLTIDDVRLVITRVGQQCKIIFGADTSQVDDSQLTPLELGVFYLHEVMSGSPMYCSLEFTDSSLRSPTCAEFIRRETAYLANKKKL